MPFWIVGMLIASYAVDRPVEISAHRGESADAPENTMAAFRLAWKRNDDAIELDVHLTKDGKLVVVHDGNHRIVRHCGLRTPFLELSCPRGVPDAIAPRCGLHGPLAGSAKHRIRATYTMV